MCVKWTVYHPVNDLSDRSELYVSIRKWIRLTKQCRHLFPNESSPSFVLTRWRLSSPRVFLLSTLAHLVDLLFPPDHLLYGGGGCGCICLLECDFFQTSRNLPRLVTIISRFCVIVFIVRDLFTREFLWIIFRSDCIHLNL